MRISDWSSDVCSSDLLLSTEQWTKRPHQTKGPANHEARFCIRRSTLRSAGEDGEAWPALRTSLEREQGYGSPHQNADRLQRQHRGPGWADRPGGICRVEDRKSTRLNSSH